MDLIGVLPYGNTIDLITLNGTDLKLALEKSASSLKLVNSSGSVWVEGGRGFLQVSGMSGKNYITALKLCLKTGFYVLKDVKRTLFFRYFQELE